MKKVSNKLNLSLQFADPTYQRDELPTRQQFFIWARAALIGCGNITIRLVDEEEMQQLNSTYRQGNYPTNVLSFPYQSSPDLHGDLVICPKVVFAEAKQTQINVNDHFAHMVIHGVLHLQDYDHLDDKEAEEMENLEIAILAKLGINNPYQ